MNWREIFTFNLPKKDNIMDYLGRVNIWFCKSKFFKTTTTTKYLFFHYV